MARQERRLYIGHQPERNAFLQVGMLDLVLLAQSPGGDDLLVGAIVHQDAAAVLFG